MPFFFLIASQEIVPFFFFSFFIASQEIVPSFFLFYIASQEFD